MASSAISKITIASAILIGCLAVKSDAPVYLETRMSPLPRVTVWAWERREDLRALSPRQFAIAYLDQTITIGRTVQNQPRRNPVAFPSSMTRMPVVRIETSSSAVLDDNARAQVVKALLLTSREPGIAALQIDFDATRSQRAFYRDLLFDLRRHMPPNLPLSITALASWCSWDDWLHDLPIDEAVPMFFRMEPDRRYASPDVDDFKIREPLCKTSAGVSTTEPWPSDMAGKRIYIFSEHGWHIDSPTGELRKLHWSLP